MLSDCHFYLNFYKLYLIMYFFFFLDGPTNSIQMSESKPLKTETSVINSPTHSKQTLKTEVTDKKV